MGKAYIRVVLRDSGWDRIDAFILAAVVMSQIRTSVCSTHKKIQNSDRCIEGVPICFLELQQAESESYIGKTN